MIAGVVILIFWLYLPAARASAEQIESGEPQARPPADGSSPPTGPSVVIW